MVLGELLKGLNYYAKPDGHAPFQKIGAVSKYAAATGLVIGLHDSMLLSRTTNFYDTARCFGFWIVPLVGMGATFASVTYMATNLRKKDDPWNYVIGAIASGSVLHAWSKCGLTTLYGTIFLSIFAAIKKDSIQSNWRFFPDPVSTENFLQFRTASAKKVTFERGWTKD